MGPEPVSVEAGPNPLSFKQYNHSIRTATWDEVHE